MSTRSELLEQLRELGVETVTAEYDGSGDEGQIGTPGGGSVPLPNDLAMAVEELNSEGRVVPTRYVAELHVKEDCGGFIPTVADWFRNIKREVWMSKGYEEKAG